VSAPTRIAPRVRKNESLASSNSLAIGSSVPRRTTSRALSAKSASTCSSIVTANSSGTVQLEGCQIFSNNSRSLLACSKPRVASSSSRRRSSRSASALSCARAAACRSDSAARSRSCRSRSALRRSRLVRIVTTATPSAPTRVAPAVIPATASALATTNTSSDARPRLGRSASAVRRRSPAHPPRQRTSLYARARNGRYWARTRLWGSGKAKWPGFAGLRCSQISLGLLKLLPNLLPSPRDSRRS
jgi:hypothetical protein